MEATADPHLIAGPAEHIADDEQRMIARKRRHAMHEGARQRSASVAAPPHAHAQRVVDDDLETRLNSRNEFRHIACENNVGCTPAPTERILILVFFLLSPSNKSPSSIVQPVCHEIKIQMPKSIDSQIAAHHRQ